jgi:hypothetical protein
MIVATIAPEASRIIPTTKAPSPRTSASAGGTTPKICGSADSSFIFGRALTASSFPEGAEQTAKRSTREAPTGIEPV